jgi:hypothetical protein
MQTKHASYIIIKKIYHFGHDAIELAYMAKCDKTEEECNNIPFCENESNDCLELKQEVHLLTTGLKERIEKYVVDDGYIMIAEADLIYQFPGVLHRVVNASDITMRDFKKHICLLR